MGWVGDRTKPEGRQRSREDCGELCRSLWIFTGTLIAEPQREPRVTFFPPLVLRLGNTPVFLSRSVGLAAERFGKPEAVINRHY